MLSLTAAPDIISFAGGLPASEYLPVAQYRSCLNKVMERDQSRSMQYSPQFLPLREWIAAHMARRGLRCQPEQVFITNGAQQGLAILSRLLLDPGQPAVIEQVTFTGIQQVTVGRGADVRTVPTDLSTGVDVDALEEAFAQSPRPHLAVIIPDFHNPLGVSLTADKRQRIAELAARYNVPLIEDDPYSSLRFMGEPLLPVTAYDDAGITFYLGSFSKILAPAMRLGWIVAPLDLIPQITVLRESLDLESSILTQKAVYEFLSQGYLENHLATFNRANRERMEVLVDSLNIHLGDVATWTHPEGGLFIWVTLPEYVDTWEMLPRAIEHKVAYVPGGAFVVEGGYRNTMRLNFSNATPEKIREGIAQLAEVIHEPVLS
jgi:2-aminoadipate transaminase